MNPVANKVRDTSKTINKLRDLSSRENYTDKNTPRLLAKLVSTFADREVSCSQRGGSPKAVFSDF
jgi:hypothetical protein